MQVVGIVGVGFITRNNLQIIKRGYSIKPNSAMNIHYLDSPNTTSATTYNSVKACGNHYGGFKFNKFNNKWWRICLKINERNSS